MYTYLLLYWGKCAIEIVLLIVSVFVSLSLKLYKCSAILYKIWGGFVGFIYIACSTKWAYKNYVLFKYYLILNEEKKKRKQDLLLCLLNIVTVMYKGR